MMRFIIFPLAWLCRWFPHKDEKVPDIVMRNIAGRYVPEEVYMCERCGRFRHVMPSRTPAEARQAPTRTTQEEL